MKKGTHSLGSNAFAQRTLVRAGEGSLVIRQMGAGNSAEVIISGDQIALLKEILA